MNPHLVCDPALPQRDLVLDAHLIAARFAARVGMSAPVGDCERVRATYRVGESLRVVHRFRLGRARIMIAGRAFTGGASRAVFARAAAQAAPCGALPAVVHEPDLDAVFWTFPNDRKILDLPARTQDARAMARALTGDAAAIAIASYAPEKSVTLALGGALPAAYAKVYAGDGAAHARRTYAALGRQLPTTDADLGLPRLLREPGYPRLLLLAAVPGRRLGMDGDAVSALARLGAALARLHELEPPAEAGPFERCEPEAIGAAAAAIGRVRPDVADHACRVEKALLASLPAPAPAVCLHGDVHAKNGIRDGDRVTLLDLDQVAVGPAAADLGSFLGTLRYQHAVGALSAAALGAATDAFLGGYAQRRGVPAAAVLRWHTAAALLVERALRAISRVRPRGLAHLESVLTAADRLLAQGHHG